MWEDYGSLPDREQLRINQNIIETLAQHATIIVKLQERLDALHAAGVKELAEQQSAAARNIVPLPSPDSVDQLFEERQS